MTRFARGLDGETKHAQSFLSAVAASCPPRSSILPAPGGPSNPTNGLLSNIGA
jgi:hypothetical protein